MLYCTQDGEFMSKYFSVDEMLCDSSYQHIEEIDPFPKLIQMIKDTFA